MSREQEVKPDNQEVKSGNYVICDININSRAVLKTIGIGTDIVFTAYAPVFGKAAMARNINAKQITELLNKLTDNKLNSAEEGSIKICLIGCDSSKGGEDAEVASANFHGVVNELRPLTCIEIIGDDTLKKAKYDSVKFTPSVSPKLEPLVVTQPITDGWIR
jgi:hypothetical protein